MTDNDWIKQLQSMMEHHEEPVGGDLWQDIEAQLPEHQAPQRPMPAWRRYAAAAAVALAVIGTGSLLWHGSGDTSVDQPTVAQTPQETSTPEPEVLAQNDVTIPDVDAPTASPHVVHAVPAKQSPSNVNNGDYIAQATAIVEEPKQGAITDKQEKQEAEPTEETSRKPLIKHDEGSKTTGTPAMASITGNVNQATHKRQPMSLEFYASNTIKPESLSSKDKTLYYFGAFDNYHLLNDSVSTQVKHERATHHVPYSLGVSVRVPLTNRLALTSGLVYTRLKSNFSGNNRREQILHYLGVPIGATYSLWNYKRFGVYAIGGVQADFDIKATVKETTKASDYNIKKDRVQFSALLGPGLQLELSQELGIYIEPTARYYFNNGSSIDNYFKDKPWNINLNAGLRFTIQ